MATSGTTHALDLPEICALIATRLTKAELGECILVSHQWANTFRPLFWRTMLVPRHKVTLCRDEDLARHGHHVRILAAGRIQQSSPFDQASVCSLQHLEVSTCGSNDEPDNGLGCLPAIVHRNKTSLSELHWMCFGWDMKLNKPYRIWPEIFLGLERLETLILSKWTISIDDFLTILKACPSLNTLTFEATEDLEDLSPLPSNSNANNSNGNKIRRRGSKMIDVSAQDDPPLFQHHGVHSVHYIGHAMPGYLRHLPKVQTLHLQDLTHGNLSTIPDEIRQSCPEIASLHILTQCSNPSRFLALVDSIHTLRSFQGRVPSEAMQDFLEMVLAKHAESIETLCLTEAESDGLRFNIWRFLENCPRLTDFQIPYKLEGSLLEAGSTVAVPTEFTSSYFSSPRFLRRRPYEPTKPWVCQDLSKLWLRIKDMDIQLMETIALDLCVDRLIPLAEKVPKAASGGGSSSYQYQQQHQTQGRVQSVGSLVGQHAHHRHGYGHGHGGARAHSPLERLIVEKLSGLKKLSKINIGSGWYDLPEMKD